MRKAIGLIGVGAVLGGSVTWIMTGSGDVDASAGANSRSLLQAIAELAGASRQTQDPGVITIAERLAVYREVAAMADVSDLRAQLERLAAAPSSSARDIEIDAVLTRLSDLEAETAATLTRMLGLDTRFITEAYVRWADFDSAAAIAALADIGSRSQRQDVALALLDVVGDDLDGVDRVARSLAESERGLLKVEWIAARAEIEPFAAFRDAEQLDPPSLRRTAVESVGVAWAAQDPRGALAQAGLLPEDLQHAFRVGVIAEWSRLDGDDFLQWLATTTSRPPEAAVGIDRLASSRAELILDIADGMDGNLAQSMRSAALVALAQSDPVAAIARAEAAPPGTDRELMLMAVASALAHEDPDAALDWARRSGLPRAVLTQITSSIVQSDLELAIELMSDPPEELDSRLLSLQVATVAARETERAEALANRLLGDDSIQAADTLRNLISSWMQHDPEQAAAWVFANETALNAGIIGSAAQAMAMADPEAAASYVNRVPAEFRSVWINQVAGRYGGQDLNGALAWVSQFQGQEVHASALRSIVAAGAQVDPRAAADILSRASSEAQRGAATQVARALAREDGRSAARWAVGLDDEGIRREALAAAITAWASTDVGAARNYTLGLDRGADRDGALNSLIMQSSQRGNFDRSLLEAYSSDRARQEALARAIPLIARNDPEGAEDLLELVTSGNTRAGLEAQLTAIARQR